MAHDYHVLRIDARSSSEMQDRVYRLRYEIYVKEMGLDIPTEDDRLTDEYDAYATNFLLIRNGVDVGTIRITNRAKGPIEVEQLDDSWKRLVEGFACERDAAVADVSRFMIHRDLRGRGAAPRLLYAVLRQCEEEGVHFVFATGKLGGLTRLYLSYCAEIYNETPLDCYFRGCRMGSYHLLLNDIRANTPDIMARILRQIIPIRDA